jgi:cyclopropane fatty-acyl-phospholipid synthase-like methyltransferase
MSAHPEEALTPWQQDQTAANFLDQRRTLLPLLDIQEQTIGHLLTRDGHQVRRLLDLGGGDGAMTRLALQYAPQAEAVLVDFSEPMLGRAKERASAGEYRCTVVRGDMREPGWQSEMQSQAGYDLAISGVAIHHLTSQRKRELFAEVFALLAPGGMFLNMDIVAIQGPLEGLFEEQMRANAKHAAHVHGHPEQEIDFDGDDDRPDTVEDQLRWLREAGFQQTEVHFKWAEAAIFGGVKPAER